MIVYKTTNLINDKVYIGQDSKNNSKYLGSGFLLKKAIKKYGQENFKKETMAICDTRDKLDFFERLYIDFCGSKVPNGYNITDGGSGGGFINKHHNEESRRKMSEIRKGKPTWNKGIPQSEETKLKISVSGCSLLRKHSEETKRIIGFIHKGKIVSEETREKMSNSKKGKTLFPELNNKEWLVRKYINEGLTMKEISNIMGCTEPTIACYLKKLNIPIWSRSIHKSKRISDI